MVTIARGFPRFLPTLTEVVQVPVQPVEPPEDLVAKEAARREAFAQRMREQLREAMDVRMQDAVAYAMLEQVDLIGDRLRQQMEDMVRESLESVTDRLRGELDLMVREAVDTVLSDEDPQTILEPDAVQPPESSP